MSCLAVNDPLLPVRALALHEICLRSDSIYGSSGRNNHSPRRVEHHLVVLPEH